MQIKKVSYNIMQVSFNFDIAYFKEKSCKQIATQLKIQHL